MKGHYIRTLTGLLPYDEAAQAYYRRLKTGDIVAIDPKRPRNYEHHKKFFALVKLVFENQDRYPTQEALLAALKISVHHVDEVIMPSGKMYFTPKSINFASMDQDRFDRFYKDCIDQVVKHFIPGISEKRLRAELLEFAA